MFGRNKYQPLSLLFLSLHVGHPFPFNPMPTLYAATPVVVLTLMRKYAKTYHSLLPVPTAFPLPLLIHIQALKTREDVKTQTSVKDVQPPQERSLELNWPVDTLNGRAVAMVSAEIFGSKMLVKNVWSKYVLESWYAGSLSSRIHHLPTRRRTFKTSRREHSDMVKDVQPPQERSLAPNWPARTSEGRAVAKGSSRAASRRSVWRARECRDPALAPFARPRFSELPRPRSLWSKTLFAERLGIHSPIDSTSGGADWREE
ncbi:hypothetical protein B0H16DRAFT_1896128 [Mycena metata]|uniref:Uncharacterized protein n=1 Tax=Mycena metata TaxID=1033252 RepID=A0AAD7HK15_9AGAR|nr:hypothetical protein B0H16DRAFT_1896128 [Mycena metata]